LPTPCALVEWEAVERNTARMAERVSTLGARLRPHVKTHKCVEAGRLQVRGHFGGITVSTLAEARLFAAAGFRDITYAVPVAPARIREALGLARGLERLTLLLDSEELLREVERCSAAQQVRASVLLKIDCGLHRCGVDPRTVEAVELAAACSRAPHVDFRGILTHAGHSYGCRDREGLRAVAREEREIAVGFAERLRGEGIAVPEVSIGSTPTLAVAEDLTGVSEVRPGNYVFFDALQVALGTCALEDVAFSVLTTVIGSFPDRLVVDAGALALSKDAGPTHLQPGCGYGLVMGEQGVEPLRVAALPQEHAVLLPRASKDLRRHPVGARLRIVPYHSGLAAALFDRYVVLKGGEPGEEWRPVRGL